jgi:GTP-binding protein
MKEFNILKNELQEYNPELLDKTIIIAISKSDLLDDELKQAISAQLPTDIPHLYISSAANQGLNQLKDILWESLNKKAS